MLAPRAISSPACERKKKKRGNFSSNQPCRRCTRYDYAPRSLLASHASPLFL
ncbi:hypothetical protein WH47_10339 [Habropoda laboriosa]|uniref:Uncharacterized protein n=1 Tax=Habropoda laboriosa TaxID=597456 RepID=A0A0L7R4S7_9HYME|nr:hypothetical protein WH47_10339 [Habropoda laboriosa]